MSLPTLQAIHQAFVGHGIDARVDSATVIVGDRLLVQAESIVRSESDRGVMTQLTVVAESVVLGRSGPLIDRFAGIGPTLAAAEANAFEKFIRASFHVIAEALSAHQCDSDQVEWEEWTGLGKSWRVCSGPLFAIGSNGCLTTSQYASVLDCLRGIFEREAEPGPHWISVFVGFNEGKMTTAEAILDGDRWESAETMLCDFAWKPSAHYETLRHLIVTTPNYAPRPSVQTESKSQSSRSWFNQLLGLLGRRTH